MTDYMSFSGKTIIIDGAAKGMGRETAVLLSRLGAKVILLDLSEEELQTVIHELNGNQHDYYVCDLSRLNQIENLVCGIIEKHGAVDGFVHCVGMRCRRPIKLIKPDVLNTVFGVNFGSFIEMVRCITQKNNFNPNLSIVAISSISAQTGGAGIMPYAASKAAMDASVRCLAKELAPKSIRLNTVLPGQINTPAYQEMFRDGSHDVVLDRQYLGLGEAVDVANAIAFLLSPNSRMITGASIPVDGGFFTS